MYDKWTVDQKHLRAYHTGYSRQTKDRYRGDFLVSYIYNYVYCRIELTIPHIF